MKANEMHYFSDLFDKVSTCFGHVPCPSSDSVVTLTMLVDTNRTRMINTPYCVYTVLGYS